MQIMCNYFCLDREDGSNNEFTGYKTDRNIHTCEAVTLKKTPSKICNVIIMI